MSTHDTVNSSEKASLEEQFYKALSIAKVDLISRDDCTFFATVCLSMQHVADYTCDTAWTNGRVCGYNPEFFLSLPAEIRTSLAFHETGHVWSDHAGRCSDRDPEVWNWAGDQVINNEAKRAKFIIPKNWLCESRFIGMSTEEVYDIRIKELDKCPEPNYPESGLKGSTAIGPDLKTPANPEEAAEIKNELDAILVQATLQSEMANDKVGSVPASVERYVNSLLNPKVPWHKLMSSYARKFAKGEYTFSKPNRRFFPDHILPSSRSLKMDRCAFIVDASGSVTDDQFSHMVCETAAFMKNLQPEMVDFIQFDTKIKSHDQLKSLADLRKVDFTGKGGTKITPVLEWIIENKPVVTVIFTDGMFHMPDLRPKTPVLWIIHSNELWDAPFGRVIHFEFDP